MAHNNHQKERGSVAKEKLNNYKSSFKHASRFSKINLTVFALIFAGLGGYLLLFSHAATIPGDVNNDGVVNATDLSLLLTNYNTNYSAAEFDSGSIVEAHDLAILLAHWGQSSGGGPAPVNSVAPYFAASTGGASCTAGCAIQGQTISVSNGSWTNTPTSYSYQWKHCPMNGSGSTLGTCTNVASGGTSASYTIQASDVGNALVPVVIATNGGGSTSTTPASTCWPNLVNQPVLPTGCSPISAVVAATQAGERFCMSSLVTCGYPDPLAGNVGVPLGTNLSTTGACAAYANGGTVSTNNTTITGCRISGVLVINATGVTVQNSMISNCANNSGTYSGGWVVQVNSGKTVTLTNDTLAGTNATTCSPSAGVWDEGGTETINGLYCYWIDTCTHETSGTDQNSYQLDNEVWNDEHYEPAYIGGRSPNTTTYNHNVMINANVPVCGGCYDHGQTAAIFASSYDGRMGPVTETNNLFSGGGYTLYGESNIPGPSGEDGPDLIQNNRFTRCLGSCSTGVPDSHGQWPNGGYWGTSLDWPSGITTWSGNVWDDNGSTVSGP